MFHNRSYKKKLSLIFLLIGLTFSVMMSVYVYMTTSYSRNAVLSSFESACSSMQANTDITLGNISKIILSIDEVEYIKDWVYADSENAFFFQSIQLKDHLNSLVFSLQSPTYHLDIWPIEKPHVAPTYSSHVVTTSALETSTEYFKNKNISTEDLDAIYNTMNSGKLNMLYPQYIDGVLENILYIKSSKLGYPILYVATIPKSSLFGDIDSLNAAIYSKDIFLPIIESDENTLLYEDYLKPSIDSPNTTFTAGQNVIFTDDFGSLNFKVAYIFNNTNLFAWQMVIGSIVLFCIILFLLHRIVVSLYAPIERAIGDDDDIIATKEKPLDEFFLLTRRNERLKELAESFSDLELSNSALVIQNKYKILLLSKDLSSFALEQYDHPNSQYVVAMFKYYIHDDINAYTNLQIYKNTLNETLMSDDNLMYIDMNASSFILILRDMDYEDIGNRLSSYLEISNTLFPDFIFDHKVTVSRPVIGLLHLHQAYLETMKIREYMNLFPNNVLIYYEQISDINLTTTSYALDTENRLIDLTIRGSVDALDVFDEIIRDNLLEKNLSNENIQTLIYALVGTILRIFQELKTTPDELIGHPINYMDWYVKWNDATTITELKSTLESIISHVSSSLFSTEKDMINHMQQYIYDNYSDDIMLNDLADRFNLSPKYCSTLFKQLTNYNFKDFLNQYRIEQAKQFISENPNIKVVDLSTMVGFNSSNSFIRVFSKYTGMTPTLYATKFKNVN